MAKTLENWKDCPVKECKNKVCLALRSDKCFTHTKGLRWAKLAVIKYIIPES